MCLATGWHTFIIGDMTHSFLKIQKQIIKWVNVQSYRTDGLWIFTIRQPYGYIWPLGVAWPLGGAVFNHLVAPFDQGTKSWNLYHTERGFKSTLCVCKGFWKVSSDWSVRLSVRLKCVGGKVVHEMKLRKRGRWVIKRAFDWSIQTNYHLPAIF